MTTATLIDALKDAGQDFEWYPTDDTMIGVVARHLKQQKPYNASCGSILDIGAGDGRVLGKLAEAAGGSSGLYAIEKAEIHLANMPANIAVVGTDFERQTLIDKEVDTIFCNPPYKRFEDWASKIIREAYCGRAYLILPQRWVDSPVIKTALESRGAKAKVLWSGDFKQADRPARAQVDVIYVDLRSPDNGYRYEREASDPFDAWFTQTFPEIGVIDTLKDETQAQEKIDGALLVGQNLVERLAELYQQHLEKMHASYRALCGIDPELLKTVGVKTAEVKEGLRAKIKGLKNLYWKELFDRLDKITARLTNGSRRVILEKMASAVHVDFTSDNAYAVTLSVLKNANEYIDSQLVDLFKELSRPENVSNFKSNQKTWDAERWRYIKNPSWNHGKQEVPSRYKLEYRIITMKYNAIRGKDSSSWDYKGNLHKDCHALLEDIMTVANNLGFANIGYVYSDWSSGTPQEFYLSSGETLMRVKAHMNGNVHIQFHQGFIKGLNVEASRLLGWIKTPQEAAAEMSIDFETARKHFESNRVFKAAEYKLLTA